MTDSGSRRLPFVKMHGAGNDFVMVDGRDLDRALAPERIRLLCDRRLGIGADGLIVVAPGPGPAVPAAAAFAMVYFNSDGGEAAMCGNGARCAVAFAHGLGLVVGEVRFGTAAGLLAGRVHGPGDVEVSLPPWRDLETELDLAGCPWTGLGFCNTGVPHLVIPVADPAALAAVDLPHWGPTLRNHPAFAPAGANVDWVAPDPAGGSFHLRTYERGVEAETLACGTGASAAAVVLSALGRAASPVTVVTRGGDVLRITVGTGERSLRLRGPVVTSFQGEVMLHG